MKKGYWLIIAIIVILFFALKPINFEIRIGDGLSEWRRNPGLQNYVVTFEGQKYYCDHVESPAGFPDKLHLYRGENDYLVLPDKYSVRKIKPLPNGPERIE